MKNFIRIFPLWLMFVLFVSHTYVFLFADDLHPAGSIQLRTAYFAGLSVVFLVYCFWITMQISEKSAT